MNLDFMEFILENKYADVNTHWITLYIFDNDAINFDSFKVEHVPTEI